MREIFIGKGDMVAPIWRELGLTFPEGWSVEQFWVPALLGTPKAQLDWYAVGPDSGPTVEVVDADTEAGETALIEGAFVARFPRADVMLYSDQWGDPERFVIVRQGGRRGPEL